MQTKKRRWPWFAIGLPIIAVLLVGGFLYARPLPLLTPEKRALAVSATPPKIDWPSGSQAAFGTTEQGILASKDNQTPRPAASAIKLLTVLTVLQNKPLKLDEQGPLIPITQTDVNIYNEYYQKNGSLAEVAAGERINERQMLEGILIPSANNYADTLAIWTFGSLEKYQAAAQAMAAKLGMKHTRVGTDASGFSPSSTSTADDLALLGMTAIKHPVIAQIVQQPEVNLPVAGIKRNTNWLLDQEGVIGIKTGNTNQAGGIFIFAANHKIDDTHKTTLVGAVQGERTVYDAIVASRSLIKQIKPYFKITTLIKKNQELATYTAPWGAKVSAVVQNDISFVSWPGSTAEPSLTLDNIVSTSPTGSQVGTLKIGDSSSQVVIDGQLAGPSWQWRIFGK